MTSRLDRIRPGNHVGRVWFDARRLWLRAWRTRTAITFDACLRAAGMLGWHTDELEFRARELSMSPAFRATRGSIARHRQQLAKLDGGRLP
jgi:hypothetical protein